MKRVSGFLAFLVLLALNGWITTRQLKTLQRSASWVEHTRQVLYTLAQSRDLVAEAETGQRGYLYTGDKRYLAPYSAARARIDQNIDRVAKLTADNPRQQAAIATLRPLLGQKFNELERTIALHNQGRDADARALVLTGLGRSLTLQIDQVIAGMQREELRLEDSRDATYQRNSHLMITSVYVTSAVAALGLLLLAFASLRESRGRERHAQHLAEREEWFRSTLTSLGDAVMAADSEGRVTFVNPVAEGLLGVKLAAAKGKPVRQVFRIFGEFTRQPLEDPVSRVLETGEIASLANHTVVERSDGDMIPIEDSAAAIRDDEGKIVGVVLVFRDASKERKTQELLRRTDKLAAAARLAATMAHEINNPLEAVGNLVYLAQIYQGTPPQVIEYLGQAEQELNRVSLIAQQTLGFYRENKRPGPVDAEELVKGVLAIHENKLRSRSIEVETHLEPCPAVIAFDGEIRQVLANLISNAADAVGREGRIWVRLSCAEGEGGIRIVIEDNGPGVAPGDRERLFEAFFTTKKDVGTGLGLWVSKEIVERHGGSLRFEDRDGPAGRRTAFIVTLPRNGLGESPEAGQMQAAEV